MGLAAAHGDLHLGTILPVRDAPAAGLEGAHFRRPVLLIRGLDLQFLQDPLVLLHYEVPLDGVPDVAQLLAAHDPGAGFKFAAQSRIVFVWKEGEEGGSLFDYSLGNIPPNYDSYCWQ